MKKLLGRRLFLQTTAAASAGLVIGCHVPPPDAPPAPKPEATEAKKDAPAPAVADGPPFAPNAWVRVAPDGFVTIILDKCEMGQGVETSLAMLVAEEIEVDLASVKTSFAPVDPVYKNRLFGMQATGGSTSIRAAWKPLREAGAAARIMLVSAAARTWKVDESECRAEKGEVIHASSGRRLGYGALAAEAAKSPLPKEPKLKDPSNFRLIGTRATRRDGPEKAAGQTVFGFDVKQPNMLTAVVVRCPVFGGTLVKFDPAKSLAVRGVKKVFKIDSGVAVVAEGFWPARKGAQALVVEWNEGKNAANSSEKITAQAAALAKKPGKVGKSKGDAEKALKAAAKKVDAIYEAPFQAHAPMEPLSCTVHIKDDSCTMWVHTQFQEAVQGTVAKATGLKPSAITIHTTFLGGAFGRKFEQDFILEAVQIATEMRGVPVKLMWSREDDLRHDYYRPASYNVLRGGIGKDNMPVAWTHRVVSPSIMSRIFPNFVKDGLDNSSLEGASDLQYGVPNLHVDYHMQDTGVPVGFWRSVGHSQNAFVTECFLDELAALGKQDPLEVRRKLLGDSPRLKAVLELAAEKAGWSKPPAEGVGRGIAAHISFGSYVAQVAEVSVGKDGQVKVHRVVCAVDCGSVVNPDTVEAQMEGAIVYGLTATLKSQITIENGRVKQGNFHNFRLLAMDEMPAVEVHIMPSKEPPGGVGEPGTPPIAPAVVNAIYAATGKRIRRLPIRAQDLKKA
jgi:isoquinoline 1-oxidoreductase beta subunit